MTKETALTTKPLPDPPADPFGAKCSGCGDSRQSTWKGGKHWRACYRCDRVDRWPR